MSPKHGAEQAELDGEAAVLVTKQETPGETNHEMNAEGQNESK